MKNKKGIIFLVLGILCLVVGFVWMIVTQASTGPFLILASVGGMLLASARGYSKKQ